MGRTRATLIADILVEHLEELEYLWGQRRAALDDPGYTPRELAHLEERIEAHVQGLLVAGEGLLPLVREGLGSDDATVVFASAYPLLRLKPARRRRARPGGFLTAKEGQLRGLTEALSHGPIGPILPRVAEATASAPPPVAVAAAEVLAFAAPASLKPDVFLRLLMHEDPSVRGHAWRVAARLKIARSPKLYQAALQDDDPTVRREALHAAAWGAQPWLLDRCRAAGRKPGPENLEELKLLAVLGGPEDLDAIRTAGRAKALGPGRFALLGAFGHPGVVEDLLEALTDPDPRVAVAAGRAFTRITGKDVASDARVQLPPEDGHEPDDFEKEFLDEAFLPDPAEGPRPLGGGPRPILRGPPLESWGRGGRWGRRRGARRTRPGVAPRGLPEGEIPGELGRATGRPREVPHAALRLVDPRIPAPPR